MIPEPGPEPPEQAVRCPHCQARMKGKFCHKCGEKKFKPADLSTRKLLSEFWMRVTHIDNRLWKTLQLLFLRPGDLTQAYCNGVRKAYLKPIQLFFIANVLYFLSLLFFQNDVFYFPLENFIKYRPFGIDYAGWVKHETLLRGWTDEAFREAFNAQIKTQGKAWVILNVPMLALIIGLLYLNQRQRFPVEHLVFSLHFYTFVLLYICLLGLAGIGLYTIGAATGLMGRLGWIVEILALFIFLYLAVALRRYYREDWGLTLLRMIPLYLGVIFSLQVYRLLIFRISLFFL